MTASGKANQKTWLQRLRWLLPQRSGCPATRWSPWMAGLLGCLFSLYTIPCPGVRNDLTNGAICFYCYIHICYQNSGGSFCKCSLTRSCILKPFGPRQTIPKVFPMLLQKCCAVCQVHWQKKALISKGWPEHQRQALLHYCHRPPLILREKHLTGMQTRSPFLRPTPSFRAWPRPEQNLE